VRPHLTIRRVIKRGGLATTVALAGVWAVSLRGPETWVFPDDSVLTCARGMVRVVFALGRRPSPPPGMFNDMCGPPTRPGMSWDNFHGWVPPFWWGWEVGRMTVFPLWAPALACGLASAWAWRLEAAARRRERVGTCAACGYDRVGSGRRRCARSAG
jgi:hypothetical protein